MPHSRRGGSDDDLDRFHGAECSRALRLTRRALTFQALLFRLAINLDRSGPVRTTSLSTGVYEVVRASLSPWPWSFVPNGCLTGGRAVPRVQRDAGVAVSGGLVKRSEVQGERLPA